MFSLFFFIIAGWTFRRNELTARRDSLLTISNNEQVQQASVLDSLPDAIIIAGKRQISYLNQQAWKLLNCQAINGDDVEINNVLCLDDVNCAVITPVEQLIRLLVNIDDRLKAISKDNFLQTMIDKATDEGMLLQLH